MAYPYPGLFAIDPSDASNVAVNAEVKIFNPHDPAREPIRLKDVGGLELPNPLETNSKGFVGVFNAELDEVAWEAGGLTGLIQSYQGVRDQALAAADRAAAAEATSQSAVVEAEGARAAAVDAASLVGAPADTAVAALFAGDSSTAAAADQRYSSRQGLPFNVLDYGATGDGIADDTGPIQTVLNLAKTLGSVSVLIPPGSYRTTKELSFFEGTVITSWGARIWRDHGGYLGINGDRGAAYPGYSGQGNILFHGGVWDGNGGERTNKASIFSFGHARNLTFNAVTFKDCVDSHHVEVNSSADVYFGRCRLVGYRQVDGDFNEAIQLDYASTDGFSAFGAYDFTACQNVTVENSYFGPSGTTNTTAPMRGIGAHSSRIGAQSSGVMIRNNTFEGLSSFAIRTYNWSNVDIDRNTITGAAGIRVETPFSGEGTGHNTIDVDGVQTSRSEECSTFRIFKNTVKVTDETLSGIYIYGDPTGYLTDVSMWGNTVEGGSNSVELLYCRGVKISSGELTNGALTGFRASFVTDLTVDGVTIRGAGEIGLLISGNINTARFTNNLISGSNRLGTDGTNYHIRSSGAGMKNIKWIGNTTERSGTGPDVLAAFSASGGSGIVRIGNTWEGSQKPGNPAVVDASTAPVVVGEPV